MCKNSGALHQAVASRALLCSLLLITACGDAGGPVTDGDDDHEASLSSALNGAQVLLSRRSSACGSLASPPLVAVMGAAVEFSPERTETLLPSCEDGPQPGVEVDIEDGSVVFDFSNVARAGAFSNARFDGYVLQFVRHCGDPIVMSAAFDLEHLDIEISASALRTHYDRVEVNFARVAYDQGTFMKVDLEWATVGCLIDAAN